MLYVSRTIYPATFTSPNPFRDQIVDSATVLSVRSKNERGQQIDFNRESTRLQRYLKKHQIAIFVIEGIDPFGWYPVSTATLETTRYTCISRPARIDNVCLPRNDLDRIANQLFHELHGLAEYLNFPVTNIICPYNDPYKEVYVRFGYSLKREKKHSAIELVRDAESVRQSIKQPEGWSPYSRFRR